MCSRSDENLFYIQRQLDWKLQFLEDIFMTSANICLTWMTEESERTLRLHYGGIKTFQLIMWWKETLQMWGDAALCWQIGELCFKTQDETNEHRKALNLFPWSELLWQSTKWGKVTAPATTFWFEYKRSWFFDWFLLCAAKCTNAFCRPSDAQGLIERRNTAATFDG